MGGWQRYSLTDGRDLNSVDATSIPIQAYLGPVGMPGVTAWYGLNRIIAPKAGETVLVSAATGAVGSVVGQLARAAGARAVGIAGGAEKCAYAVNELGYAACVDHKSPSFAEELEAAVPSGVDGVFENVGGKPFQQALRRLNDFARVAVCGLIASYEGAPTALPDMRIFLVRRIKVEGFIVSDHPSLWLAGDRRACRPYRCRAAEVARDGPGRHRERAAGAGRPPARREFRQDADPGGLSQTQRTPCDLSPVEMRPICVYLSSRARGTTGRG